MASAYEQGTYTLFGKAVKALERIATAAERIAEASERSAHMAEQDPLRAVDRLLALGESPADPAATLETMNRRADMIQDMQDMATGTPQDGHSEAITYKPLSPITEEEIAAAMASGSGGSSEVMEEILRMASADDRPSPEDVAAARARAAERAGKRPPSTKPADDDDDVLPASERWRLN